MPKCKVCGESRPLSADMIKIRDRVYVCSQKCKMQYDIDHKGEPIPAPKPKPEKVQLTDYIQQIQDGDQQYWSMVNGIISNLIKKYGFTYKGIELTLRYMFEVKKIAETRSFLPLVPYYYNETKEYYIETLAIEQAFENFEDDKEVVLTSNPKKNRRPDLDLRNGV